MKLKYDERLSNFAFNFSLRRYNLETHNFPSGVAPYPGAETGAGGRMRDTHATGIGSLLTAGTSGYCVGNLRIPGEEMAHEVGGLLRASPCTKSSLLLLLRH